MVRMFGVSFVCGLCVIAAGCGGGVAAVSVSGTVTVDGEPIEGATVVFTPLAVAKDGTAIASHGKTDSSGKYTLMTTVTEQSGAVVGKHNVTISKFGGEEDEESDEIVEDYVDPIPEHSFTFDVPSSGTDRANFSLSFSESTDNSSSGNDGESDDGSDD